MSGSGMIILVVISQDLLSPAFFNLESNNGEIILKAVDREYYLN
jgi:hypothetical protein